MSPSKLAPALLFVALSAASAGIAEERLDAANFRAVGDVIVDMLEAAGVTLGAMTLGLDATREPAWQSASLAPGSRPPRERVEHAACPGGGRATVRTLDADASQGLSPGDRVEVRFERCGSAGRTVNGVSRFQIAALRNEPGREVTELEFEFEALGTAALHWSGHAQVQLDTQLASGAEHDLVRYRDLQVHLHGQPMQWNFTLDVHRPPIGGQVASFEGPLRIGPLALQLRQDEPFQIDEQGRPRVGQLSALDVAGARLEIRVQPGGYAYGYSAAPRGPS